MSYQIGYNIKAFRGTYQSGSGWLQDSIRHIWPLIKTYGKNKLQQFSSSLGEELGKGESLKSALKSSAKSTAQKVLSGQGRKRKTKKRVIKKRRVSKKRRVVRSKKDFFDTIE